MPHILSRYSRFLIKLAQKVLSIQHVFRPTLYSFPVFLLYSLVYPSLCCTYLPCSPSFYLFMSPKFPFSLHILCLPFSVVYSFILYHTRVGKERKNTQGSHINVYNCKGGFNLSFRDRKKGVKFKE